MTDAERASKREEMLSEMSDEERQSWLEQEKEYDRQVARLYSEKLGVSVEIIENDPNHILVDGEVMGYSAFEAYCAEHLPEEDYDDEEYEEESDEYCLDEGINNHLGWF